MKRDKGYYRDDDFVLRCRHGHKLHLACEHCEQSDREQRESDATLYRNAAWVACCFLGVALGVILAIL